MSPINKKILKYIKKSKEIKLSFLNFNLTLKVEDLKIETNEDFNLISIYTKDMNFTIDTNGLKKDDFKLHNCEFYDYKNKYGVCFL